MPRLLISFLLSLPLIGIAGAEPPAESWPYPQDIPDVQKAAPGLAGEEPVDIIRFLLMHTSGGAELSPDGSQLAFTTSLTGVPQLWLVPADSGWPIQLTYGAGVRSYEWLPDGSALLYSADTLGDEREGFYLISADGRKEREVLAPSAAYRVPGDIAPDGQRLVYATTERNGVDFDIHLLEIATGSSTKLYEGRFGFFPGAWQPGGPNVIVTETRGEDARDLHLLDTATGDLTTLSRPADPAFHGSFQWLPDGSGFYLVTNLDREYQGIALYDLELRTLRWIHTPERDVDAVTLSPDASQLAWTENDGGYSQLYVRDLETGRVQQPSTLPAGVYDISFAAEAPVLAIEISGPALPGDIWTWSLNDDEPVRATRSGHAGIDLEAMVTPQSVWFEARDGVRLHGLLYLPPAKAVTGDGKPPVVVDVHGGPTSQARPTFQPVTQFLLTRGIAVLDLNFRGSTGFGKSFARLDNQRNRPKTVRDVVDALRFLERDGRVDASRAAVMGGSYGGYLTNAVMAEYPGVFDAGVSFVGVSDWVRALEEASPALKASDRLEYGDITDPEDREFFRSISPIAKADSIRDPMFFVHGANDPRDPVTESDRLVSKLRGNDVAVTYLRFPDEGHGIRKVDNRVHTYRAVAEFLLDQLVREPTRSSRSSIDH